MKRQCDSHDSSTIDSKKIDPDRITACIEFIRKLDPNDTALEWQKYAIIDILEKNPEDQNYLGVFPLVRNIEDMIKRAGKASFSFFSKNDDKANINFLHGSISKYRDRGYSFSIKERLENQEPVENNTQHSP